MSQADIDLVRHINALGNAGRWDELIALVDPDIEWRDQMHAPDVPKVLNGIDEVLKLFGEWYAAYETLTAEVLEYMDADPWVICVTRWHGRGAGSGLPVEVRSVDCFEVCDGKLRRSYGGYADLESARTAIAEAGRVASREA